MHSFTSKSKEEDKYQVLSCSILTSDTVDTKKSKALNRKTMDKRGTTNVQNELFIMQ